MPGTLVIGCGGPGRSSVSQLASEGYRCLTLDWQGADVDLLPPGMTEADLKSEPELAEKLLNARCNEISLNMKGFSEVVLVTNLGGTLGGVCVPVISRCARDNGCRFITVLSVPFVFEESRREAAMSMLPSMTGYADRTFVMDMQYSGVSSMVASEALVAVDGLFRIAARTVSDLIGSIPFMSTFPDPMYSFSRGFGESKMGSLEKCLHNPFFDVSGKTSWKLVICSDSPVSEVERESIIGRVTGINGSLPQIIERDGVGDGLTVFIPIFLQT